MVDTVAPMRNSVRRAVQAVAQLLGHSEAAVLKNHIRYSTKSKAKLSRERKLWREYAEVHLANLRDYAESDPRIDPRRYYETEQDYVARCKKDAESHHASGKRHYDEYLDYLTFETDFFADKAKNGDPQVRVRFDDDDCTDTPWQSERLLWRIKREGSRTRATVVKRSE